jgi:hypothetical protein
MPTGLIHRDPVLIVLKYTGVIRQSQVWNVHTSVAPQALLANWDLRDLMCSDTAAKPSGLATACGARSLSAASKAASTTAGDTASEVHCWSVNRVAIHPVTRRCTPELGGAGRAKIVLEASSLTPCMIWGALYSKRVIRDRWSAGLCMTYNHPQTQGQLQFDTKIK